MEKDDLQKTQVLKTRFLHGFFHSPKLYISWKSSFKNSICYCEIEFKRLNVRYLKSFKTVLTNKIVCLYSYSPAAPPPPGPHTRAHTHTHTLKKITFAKVNSSVFFFLGHFTGARNMLFSPVSWKNSCLSKLIPKIQTFKGREGERERERGSNSQTLI